ncbi:prolow-density lipoprotein receptor-related protein 1-like isoform X2 [Patiria miniata]|uniref:Uncharacterized protein n=1 Tax=Patiria miniata TaxID=46514 RepID=A0A914BH93_PATMI|nr:prolow-density lipoprotein receptor-related protein 1-like isoform X2 [Patiria miniata]
MGHLLVEGLLGVVWVFLLLGAAFQPVQAGDFALVADLHNGTIYGGSMGRGLADIAPLPLNDVKRPVAVDYDPIDRMVYWSDLASLPSPRISRAHLNGSSQMIVVDQLHLPDGLALDVEARMMYWTDGIIGYIGRVRMDGTGGRETIVDGLDKPRTIIIDHENGFIYWTDWGNSSKIERADLDGSNRMTLVSDDLVWPNGVVKDGDKLYWCDANLDKIERSDLSGNNRELLIDLTSYSNIHPFDLAVYGDYVYWTDWGYVTLIRVHTSGVGAQNYGPHTFQQSGGLHIEKEPNYCDSTPCHNGATCVDVINGFSCICPAGYQGLTCFEDPCGSGPCANGATCTILPTSGFNCQCPSGYAGPTCMMVVHCVVSLDPSDVLMVTSGQRDVYLPGESVTFACPDGYQFGGSATRFCQSDFTWSGQPAECIQEDPCGSRPCANGATCTILPTGGFNCQCPSGYAGPTCMMDRCNSGPCLNGGTCTSVQGGFTCHCLAGYDGDTCSIVIGCLPPITSTHVTLVESDIALFQAGEVATFMCDSGYAVTGSTNDQSATRVCLSGGTWSGEPVSCSPTSPNPTPPVIGCLPPITSNHVTLVESDVALFQAGEVATFMCDRGYAVTGSRSDQSATRVCLSGGTWSGDQVLCSLTSPNPTPAPPEKSYVSAIAGGGCGLAFLILVLFGVLVVMKRRRIRNGDRTVRVPVNMDLIVAGKTNYGEAHHGSDNPTHIYETSVCQSWQAHGNPPPPPHVSAPDPIYMDVSDYDTSLVSKI